MFITDSGASTTCKRGIVLGKLLLLQPERILFVIQSLWLLVIPAAGTFEKKKGNSSQHYVIASIGFNASGTHEQHSSSPRFCSWLSIKVKKCLFLGLKNAC